jgi:TolB protein
MRKFYLLFGLLSFIGISVVVQSCNESTVEPNLYGNISGTVKTSEGSKPLEGVTITTNPGTTSVVTDADGKFDLGQVLVNDYSVNAKKEDYTSVNTSITVRDDQNVVVDIVMEVAPPDSKIPDELIYVSPVDIKDDNTKLSTEVKLTWRNGETEKGDTLRFDVILYEGAGDIDGTKVASNILDTTFTVESLKFETTYEWQIVARNKELDEVEGKKWRFTTEDYPNNGFFFVKDTLGSKDIYSWDLKKNHLVRLTEDGGSELFPRVSPNEELVAYSSNKTGEYHIYTMSLKGGNKNQITSKPIAGFHNNGSGFSWSPDGSQIAYSNYSDLYVINVDGTGLESIAKAPVDRQFKECDWTSQFNYVTQEKIVVLTQGEKPYQNEIYLMDPDGTNQEVLVGDLKGTLSNPQFSPDGSKVIFSLDTLYEDDSGRQLHAMIYSINVDGTSLTNLSESSSSSNDNTGSDSSTPAGTNDLQARFSETGGKIIFMNVANDGEGERKIYTMDPDGSNRTEIIKNAEMPEWVNL